MVTHAQVPLVVHMYHHKRNLCIHCGGLLMHKLVLPIDLCQMGNHTDLSPDFEDEAGLKLGNPSCDGCFDSVAAHKEYHV